MGEFMSFAVSATPRFAISILPTESDNDNPVNHVNLDKLKRSSVSEDRDIAYLCGDNDADFWNKLNNEAAQKHPIYNALVPGLIGVIGGIAMSIFFMGGLSFTGNGTGNRLGVFGPVHEICSTCRRNQANPNILISIFQEIFNREKTFSLDQADYSSHIDSCTSDIKEFMYCRFMINCLGDIWDFICYNYQATIAVAAISAVHTAYLRRRVLQRRDLSDDLEYRFTKIARRLKELNDSSYVTAISRRKEFILQSMKNNLELLTPEMIDEISKELFDSLQNQQRQIPSS
jgi:hypothetical protein